MFFVARRTAAWATAVMLALGLAAASRADAQPSRVSRAIVLRFAGPQGDVARQAVMVGIAPFVELVDERNAIATAQEMGVDVSTPDGMARVVEEMGVSLVVLGTVEGRRGPTTIAIVDPQGEELASVEAPGPQEPVAIGDRAVEAVQQAEAALRARANGGGGAAEDPVDPDEGRDGPSPSNGGSGVTDPEVGAGDDPERPGGDERPSVPLPGWRQPMVSMLGGLRVRAQLTQALGADGRGPFFATDGYPEIDLSVAVRPLASANDLIRGLYFGAEGAFSLGIRYRDTVGGERDMTSFRMRFDGGFGYSGEIFEIVGMLGLGIEGVSLDQSDGFESILYTYLRPAAMARIQAYESIVVVELGLGARIGLDAGSLAAAYGPGLAFGGGDLFLGVGGIIEGFTYAARLGLSYLALGFEGAGGSRFDADGGLDEAIEGRFLVGYSIF
ncbi:MAG: hypothetical protein AB7S26_37280 [Sandaracinaceae bacterium]